MRALVFASDTEALQYLADITGVTVRVAAEPAVKKEGEATFKTKLTDVSGLPKKLT